MSLGLVAAVALVFGVVSEEGQSRGHSRGGAVGAHAHKHGGGAGCSRPDHAAALSTSGARLAGETGDGRRVARAPLD